MNPQLRPRLQDPFQTSGGDSFNSRFRVQGFIGFGGTPQLFKEFPCLRVFGLAPKQSSPGDLYKLSGGDRQLAVLDVRESFQCFSQGLCTRGSLGRAGLGSWEGHVPDFDSSQSEALRITPQEMLFVRT